MELPQNDFDRLVFFEHARQTAEANYVANPMDAENLTRWGGALLELSQFQSGPECIKMVKEAITRLEEALEVDPKRHSALWCLGNAHTSHAFLSTDQATAKLYFAKAAEYFQKAADEDPGNELYLKSLEVTAKFSEAPDLHLELQRQAATVAEPTTPGGSSFLKAKVSKKKDSDLKYDVCGWIILAIGIVAWVGMAKSQLPPPPTR